jgi:hypothetical protein
VLDEFGHVLVGSRVTRRDEVSGLAFHQPGGTGVSEVWRLAINTEKGKLPIDVQTTSVGQRPSNLEVSREAIAHGVNQRLGNLQVRALVWLPTCFLLSRHHRLNQKKERCA